jgi:hypothetical protein
MSVANQFSAFLATVIMALLAWNYASNRRHSDPPDMPTRQRRFRIAWEVRGLVAMIAGPYAVGILLGYQPTDYALPLLLFVVAGFVVAERIAPNGLHVHR